MKTSKAHPSKHASSSGLLRLAGLLVLLLLSACHDPGPQIPAPRFAGSDLPYVLQRRAGEAELPLLLDEVRIGSETRGRLGLVRVADRFGPGPLQRAIDRLREASDSSFTYQIREDVLIVQNTRAAAAAAGASFDPEGFAATRLRVDLKQLLAWIAEQAPGTYLRLGARRGQPVPQTVELEIEQGASVIDVLAAYGAAI